MRVEDDKVDTYILHTTNKRQISKRTSVHERRVLVYCEFESKPTRINDEPVNSKLFDRLP